MKLDEAYKIAGVITEDSLNRLQEVHRKNGYAIVSACRNEFTKEENEKRTNQLKEILQKSSFSFKKVLGGFIETKEDGSKKEVKEKSFIIYNYDKDGNVAEKDKLFKFALQICKKFNFKFEKKIPVLNGCKYKFIPTIKISKNNLEKAINNSLLREKLREIYLIGVSFIETN